MGLKAIGGKNGKHGHFVINNSNPGEFGTVDFCVEHWSLQEFVKEEETTHSRSEGRVEYEYGDTYCKVQIVFTLDLSQHPLENPPGFIVGQPLPGQVWLLEHELVGTPQDSGWRFPVLSVTGVSIQCPAIGKVQYTIDMSSNGLYYRPYTTSTSGS